MLIHHGLEQNWNTPYNAALRSVLGGEMQVKPQTNVSPKSAFFFFCPFDIIQNFKQAGNKIPSWQCHTGGTTHKPSRKQVLAIQVEHQQKARGALMPCFTNARQSAKSIAYKRQGTFANHPTSLWYSKTWANKNKNKILQICFVLKTDNIPALQKTFYLLFISNHFLLCPLLLFINYVVLQKQTTY